MSAKIEARRQLPGRSLDRWEPSKTSPAQPELDVVNREAYSHKVISFGFCAGDETVPEPTYYSYTASKPAGLREQPLGPAQLGDLLGR